MAGKNKITIDDVSDLLNPERLVFIDTALALTKKGWVVHPLSSPRDEKSPNPGKKPIFTNWQNKKQASKSEINKWFGSTDDNLGLVCGKESNVIVIDFDKLDWVDAIFPEEQKILENTLRAGRKEGRGHAYFKYTSDIKAQKLLDFGIEILSDGNNAVLPPSIHTEGQQYRFIFPKDQTIETFELPDLSKIVIKNIHLLKTFSGKIKACRPCFRWIIHQSKDAMHGHEGRRLMLAIATEMKANDITLDEFRLYARKVYGPEYDPKRTQQEWKNVDAEKCWKCETVCENFPVIAKLCDTCPSRSLDKNYVDLETTKKAIEIMTIGDPIKYILDTWNKFHTGDRPFGYVLLCSGVCSSIEASDGLPINFNGDSGGGKSHACRSMIHLMPQRWWIRRSLSDKALFYSQSIQPDMIFLSDDAEMSDDMKMIFKNSVSDFQEQIEHETVNIQRKADVLKAPPRLTWWLTAVTDVGDAQVERRCLKIAIEPTEERKKVITERFLQRKMLGEAKYPEYPEVRICRAIFKELKSKRERVVFNFQIEFRTDADINTQSIVYELMTATSLIYKYQRQRTEEGAIIATRKDFDLVVDTFSRISDTQVSKLTKSELLVARYLHQVGYASSNDIQKHLKKSHAWVFYALKGRNGDGGLLSKLPNVVEEDVSKKDETETTREKQYLFVGEWNPLDIFQKIAWIKESQSTKGG